MWQIHILFSFWFWNPLITSEVIALLVDITAGHFFNRWATTLSIQVKRVHLLPESSSFSIDNDMLTPTFKKKRHNIRDSYKSVLEKLYSGLHWTFIVSLRLFQIKVTQEWQNLMSSSIETQIEDAFHCPLVHIWQVAKFQGDNEKF